MKTIAKGLITNKAGSFGFATVCASLIAAGVYAKLAVNRLSEQEDAFCERFSHPSQVYVWSQAKRQKTNAVAFKTEHETIPVQTVTSTTGTQGLP